MVEELSPWEKAYRETSSLWGLEPERTLVKYARLIPKGPVLDLGIGEGRNALFFAKMGYAVEGIDLSETAITRCLERARQANLRVAARVADLRSVTIPPAKFTLIIGAWVLQFLRKTKVETIVERLHAGLIDGGLVYAIVFSREDPGYQEFQDQHEPVDGEAHTFYDASMKTYIHYFTKAELTALFAGFSPVYCMEGIMTELDSGEPHQHGVVEFLGRKHSF
ncbi:MAG: class I SAM-dependent methyltransferase [Candidatus Hodarchaeota archaeon]